MAGVQLSLTRVHSARLLIRDVPPNMRLPEATAEVAPSKVIRAGELLG